MQFTPAERRLLALLAVLLGFGYANAALCHLTLLPARWCRGQRAEQGATSPAALPPAALPAAASGARIPDAPSAASHPTDAPASLFREGALDLRRADSLALCALPGIGPTLTHRILTFRRQRGFTRLEQLQEVKGIGATRFAKLRWFLTLGPPDSSREPAAEAGTPRRGPDGGSQPAGVQTAR
ncbi:MAG: hypothetical protein GF330_14425 [Candidatus Eisenbacteria bacterium]|nr:hypothetical protein [Candidatus Eisenbacteria bacterium]